MAEVLETMKSVIRRFERAMRVILADDVKAGADSVEPAIGQEDWNTLLSSVSSLNNAVLTNKIDFAHRITRCVYAYCQVVSVLCLRNSWMRARGYRYASHGTFPCEAYPYPRARA